MKRNPFIQSRAILEFYQWLRPDFVLPESISMMNPFADPVSWPLIERFYTNFYSDANQRIFIFGINPGRFGSGVTGIPFTDPIRLQEKCGIDNDFRKLPELSSVFIYQMIDAFGGPSPFYQNFFITAISPLGFVKDGKNLNYYDDLNLLRDCESFIVSCIRRQLETLYPGRICFCLGEGENYKQFSRLNAIHQFFEKIIPLPHPRWIMQYRRKKLNDYVKLYVEQFNSVKQVGSFIAPPR
jgi:hypothetical protein